MKATTLTIFKSSIRKTNETDDANIIANINYVTKIIETYLRRNLSLTSVTEIHSGDDTDEIFPYQSPVKTLTSIYFSDELQTLTDFYIDFESSIVYAEGTYPKGNRNISITYESGIEEIIVNNHNKSIKFKYDSSVYTAEVSTGKQTLAVFMANLKSAMDTESGGVFTITYDYGTNKFKISADEEIELLFAAADAPVDSIHLLLGFSSANKTGEVTYTADNEIIPLPDDIIYAANAMVKRLWDDEIKGKFDFKKKEFDKIGTIEYIISEFPRNVQTILDNYRALLC